MLKIGRYKTTAKEFFYDGCHKIYLIETPQDKQDFFERGWTQDDIFPISELVATYQKSCPLKFISDCKLTKYFARQFCNGVTFNFDNHIIICR